MSVFLSFLGGASKQFVASAEQAEQDAKEMAKASFNGLYKRFEENADSNRELTNKMEAERKYIKTMWSNATPEQINELVANPVALEAIKKTKNPSAVSLDNYIKVIQGNESKAVAAERAAALGPLIERTKESLRPAKKEGYAGFMQGFGETRFDADMEKYARGQGLTLDEMRSNAKMARPVGSATFDMGVLQEAPGSMKEIIDAGEVSRFQAAQKFGKDSDQYKQADAVVKAAEEETVKVDTKLEQRADRLNLQLLDEEDPMKKKAIQDDLKSTQIAIKNHKEATSTRAEREAGGTTTIPKLRTSVDMYVNNRMMDDKGFDWKRYIDFKQIPLADGSVYVSPTVKVGLDIEDQRKINEKVRMLQADALKTNGYIVGGVPRSDAVKEFINNNNIPTDYYSGKATPAPKEQPLPVANAPATNSVTVGGKVYNRPANFTDDQWDQYKKSVGAK